MCWFSANLLLRLAMQQRMLQLLSCGSRLLSQTEGHVFFFQALQFVLQHAWGNHTAFTGEPISDLASQFLQQCQACKGLQPCNVLEVLRLRGHQSPRTEAFAAGTGPAVIVAATPSVSCSPQEPDCVDDADCPLLKEQDNQKPKPKAPKRRVKAEGAVPRIRRTSQKTGDSSIRDQGGSKQASSQAQATVSETNAAETSAGSVDIKALSPKARPKIKRRGESRDSVSARPSKPAERGNSAGCKQDKQIDKDLDGMTLAEAARLRTRQKQKLSSSSSKASQACQVDAHVQF